MEDTVFHQEYVIVLMVGVEIHVPHICKILYLRSWLLLLYIIIKLFVLMAVSMVENVLHQKCVHVLLDGLVMTAG